MKPHTMFLTPRFFCVLAVVWLAMAGCNSTPISLNETPTATPAHFSNATLTPTAIVTSTPTATPAPTLTTIPHTRVTPTPTPQPTFTPPPTLTGKQKSEFVETMLLPNAQCALPCWWEIIPGQTTVETATTFFTVRGLPWYHFKSPSRELYSLHFDLLDVNFVVSGKIIQEIEVLGGPIKNSNAIYAYSWQQIIARYGKPSQILIHFVPPIEVDSPVYYTLSLIYESLGFVVSYQGPAIYAPPVIRTCSNFADVTGITMRLCAANSEELCWNPASENNSRLLEEVVDMDIDTFYETFKDANSMLCLESAADIWP